MTRHPQCLVADPPWKFTDALPGKRRGAVKHYACLSLAEIMAFELPRMAADSLLFLWRVAAMQEEALQVARAWGFAPKAEIVWEKETDSGKQAFGMGHYVRNSHESALICTRGSPKILSHSIRSSFRAPIGRHSAKPERFYDLVEQMIGGPYVELFARRQRAGWTCYGNELSEAAE